MSSTTQLLFFKPH